MDTKYQPKFSIGEIVIWGRGRTYECLAQVVDHRQINGHHWLYQLGDAETGSVESWPTEKSETELDHVNSF